MDNKVEIPPKAVEEIAEILRKGKSAEVSMRHGHLIIWEMTSKKKYDEVAVGQDGGNGHNGSLA